VGRGSPGSPGNRPTALEQIANWEVEENEKAISRRVGLLLHMCAKHGEGEKVFFSERKRANG